MRLPTCQNPHLCRLSSPLVVPGMRIVLLSLATDHNKHQQRDPPSISKHLAFAHITVKPLTSANRRVRSKVVLASVVSQQPAAHFFYSYLASTSGFVWCVKLQQFIVWYVDIESSPRSTFFPVVVRDFAQMPDWWYRTASSTVRGNVLKYVRQSYWSISNT